MKKILFYSPVILIVTILISSCAQATSTPPLTITASPTISPSFTPVASQTGSPTPSPSATPRFTLEVTKPASVLASPTPTASSAPDTPTPTSTPEQVLFTPTATVMVSCTNTAGFFGDVTIPDGTSLQQNVPFVKTWAIRNEGTCSWGPDYSLIFFGGDQMSGPLSVPLPAVMPEEIGRISVDLKSPSSGGTFTGIWVFQDPSGKRFGVNSEGIDQIWVKIGVTIFNDQGVIVPIGATPLPSPTPSDNEASNTQNTCSPQQNSDYDQQILKFINDARAQNNLSPLRLNSKLSAAAYTHSADMACNNYVDHAGSDGSTWFTHVKAQKYTYSYASENIYVGDPAFGGTPDGAFAWWMNSQVHRDNILSPKVSEIGIGYAFYSSSNYRGYYTLDFAKP